MNRHAICDYIEATEFLRPLQIDPGIADRVETTIDELGKAMRGTSKLSSALLRKMVVEALGSQVIGD